MSRRVLASLVIASALTTAMWAPQAVARIALNGISATGFSDAQTIVVPARLALNGISATGLSDAQPVVLGIEPEGEADDAVGNQGVNIGDQPILQ
jgi:hypothetical protein